MNEKDVINQLQSSTVRAALIALAINGLTLITAFTGKIFDIEAIKATLENGYTLAINALTMWLAWKAFTGRIKAEKKIEPLPWLEAAKHMRKE